MNPEPKLQHALMALEFIAEDCTSYLDGEITHVDIVDFLKLVRDFAARQHKKLSSEQS